MCTLCRERGGIGLSAVQVGIAYKLFVICPPGTDDNIVILNGSYEKLGPEIQSKEGCLSIPGKWYTVPRSAKIKFEGIQFDKGKGTFDRITMPEVEGMLSIIIQHEIDHQNGILISDSGLEC